MIDEIKTQIAEDDGTVPPHSPAVSMYALDVLIAFLCNTRKKEEKRKRKKKVQSSQELQVPKRDDGWDGYRISVIQTRHEPLSCMYVCRRDSSLVCIVILIPVVENVPRKVGAIRQG